MLQHQQTSRVYKNKRSDLRKQMCEWEERKDIFSVQRIINCHSQPTKVHMHTRSKEAPLKILTLPINQTDHILEPIYHKI